MTNHSTLARSSPELQGVSSSAVSGFLDAIDREGLEVHSVMLLRHGHVVAEGWWEPYSSARVHLLYSLSKSFTVTAIGLAVAEGRLSVDDPVLSFFPDEAPEKAGEYLAGMRVRHLLSMATGHLTDTLDRLIEQGGGNWIKGFLALPPPRAPGTVFTYNNGATFMLSAILEKLTGTKLLDYLRPRLLEPLGITEAYWHENPQGITLGFTGLHLTTEAVARFGQLYLQRGRWQGRHLVPEWWVAEATTLQVPTAPPPEDSVTDWAQGYGYQFWRCRHGAYRGDGAFGQFCVVMPEQDAVLVTTAAVENMQTVLDLVWRHLLPAMGHAQLSGDTHSRRILSDQLAKLTIPPIQGERISAVAERVSGQSYVFEPQEEDRINKEDLSVHELTLRLHEDRWLLFIRSEVGNHEFACGHDTWLPGSTTFYSSQAAQVMVSGAWISPDTFTAKIYYIETPHCLNVSCRFGDDAVVLDMHWNVRFGPVELPQRVGRRRPAAPRGRTERS